MSSAATNLNQVEKVAATINKCGNSSCGCGQGCGCVYGACTCVAFDEDEKDGATAISALVDNKLSVSVDARSLQELLPMHGANDAAKRVEEEKILNINIGILGHVNSGKTTLVRALSRTLSTAALDKNPQSRERGMTLDLGFSSFGMKAFPPLNKTYDRVQYTLVDCPGHSSLIRTIIGGAQIIDRALLIVDATKGMQLQTAECLVIAEILTDNLLVVFNKIDLFPEADRQDELAKAQSLFRQALSGTKFSEAPFVSISAFVNGEKAVDAIDNEALPTINLKDLVQHIQDTTAPPNRSSVDASLYFSVDHCFPIKGQGTVLTGTVLSGRVRVGDEVEVSSLGEVRKVKSMQRFKNSVNELAQGDRGAICVTNLDASKIERAIAFTPGSITTSKAVVALIRKIRYFDKPCKTGSKLHCTLGPSTALATVTFFGGNQLREVAKSLLGKQIPIDHAVYASLESTLWELDDALRQGGKEAGGPMLQFALLEFDAQHVCPNLVPIIASRLDTDQASASCRIAFYGRVVKVVPQQASPVLPLLKLFKFKHRTGVVDRVESAAKKKAVDPNELVNALIGKGLFGTGADVAPFVNMQVEIGLKDASQEKGFRLEGGDVGVIEGPFGLTGKYKVVFRGPGSKARAGDFLILTFKKLYFYFATGNGEVKKDVSKSVITQAKA